MKNLRKLLVVLSLLVIFAGLGSCKKCTECCYEFQGVDYCSGKQCGYRKEIQQLKNSWEAYEETGEVQVICTDF